MVNSSFAFWNFLEYTLNIFHPWLVESMNALPVDMGPAGGACVCIFMVKNPPAMQETWFKSLSWEYPLEKGMATHSSIIWRIPWTEEPGGLQSMGSQRDTTK